jgi:uncharacterized protein with beta-barrel porin domain
VAGVAATFAFSLVFAAPQASAQLCLNPPCPTPESTGFANIAASSAALDRVSDFLNHQTRQMAAGRVGLPVSPAGRVALAYGDTAEQNRGDPLNAFASSINKAPVTAPAAAPRYRAWFEGYGSDATTGAQGTFTGDQRRAWGGIAGIGATIAPNVNVGFSVDQSRTDVNVNALLPQGSRMDVTQLGAMLSTNSGPWTLGLAGVYGFGNIHSSRFDAVGEATASYGTRMWGVIAEVNYYLSHEGWRVVPKAGADWTRVAVDSYTEAGGGVPISASDQGTERGRVYAAVEFGRSAVVGLQIFDVSVYGKFIDIVSQDVGALLVTPATVGFVPATVPGVVDARFEFATGAVFSVRVSSMVQLYANYNGRFRDGYESHGGSLGAEFRW